MEGTVTVRGMVVVGAPLGEYDKRLVLLTQERGKITVFAHGARRSSSKYGAATRPFAMGTFELSPVKDAYTLRSAEISEYFEGLAYDIVRATYASYFLEFACFYCHENVDCTHMLNLLYVSLKALLKEDGIGPEAVRTAFEARAMAINGEFPDVFSCSNGGCRGKLTRAVYVPAKGTLFCPLCAASDGSGQCLNEKDLAILQRMAAAPLGKLFGSLKEFDDFEGARKMVRVHRSHFVNARFKSLEVLESLE